MMFLIWEVTDWSPDATTSKYTQIGYVDTHKFIQKSNMNAQMIVNISWDEH